MIVTSIAFEPTCPAHPKQELRIEFSTSGRTGFCPLCPTHYCLCEEAKGRHPCMKLEGHEGEHSGDADDRDLAERMSHERFSSTSTGRTQHAEPNPPGVPRKALDVRKLEPFPSLIAEGHTGHCAARQMFGDGECDCGKGHTPTDVKGPLLLGMIPGPLGSFGWSDSEPANIAEVVQEERMTYVMREKAYYVDPNGTDDLPAALAGRVERPSMGCSTEGPDAFDSRDLRKLMKTVSFSFPEAPLVSYGTGGPAEMEIFNVEVTSDAARLAPEAREEIIEELKIRWSIPPKCSHDAERVPPLPKCTMCAGTGKERDTIVGIALSGVTTACCCTCAECRRLAGDQEVLPHKN